MSVTAEGIGRKAVKIANSILSMTVVVIILLLAAFSGYALWDSNQVFNAADAAQYEIYKPSAQNEGQSFKELQSINPEVFAWLTVYGTHIDYPVTQTGDNNKYVNQNARGEYSLTGNIFLDCDNRNDFSDFNSILYGHHMEREAMFGEIGLFKEEKYFAAREYGGLYYGGREHGLEFFAFLHVDAYDFVIFTAGVQGEDAQQKYLDNLLRKAKYTRDIGITANDRIVLLSTCSAESTNGRDILVARISEQTFEDRTDTKMDAANNTGVQTAADRQDGIWGKLPRWLWVLLAAVVILVLLNVVIHYRKK